MAIAEHRRNPATAGRLDDAGPPARPTIDAGGMERARVAAASMCAAARVLARHVDDGPSRRAALLARIEQAEQELRRLFA